MNLNRKDVFITKSEPSFQIRINFLLTITKKNVNYNGMNAMVKISVQWYFQLSFTSIVHKVLSSRF